jgi:hypothetical protein
LIDKFQFDDAEPFLLFFHMAAGAAIEHSLYCCQGLIMYETSCCGLLHKPAGTLATT